MTRDCADLGNPIIAPRQPDSLEGKNAHVTVRVEGLFVIGHECYLGKVIGIWKHRGMIVIWLLC